jgi:uncharacterized protein
MIPKFPNFKRLELSDKKEIERIVFKFSPHSTFNFTNLFAWDVRDNRKISKLNGNLVVLYSVFFVKKPFFSFLGSNRCENTVFKLLDFANKLNISPELRFITKESIDCLKSKNLCVTEDRDNFDYLFSPSNLAEFRGVKFKEHRYLVRRFKKEYPNAVFQIKDLNDPLMQKNIYRMLKQWGFRKKEEGKTFDLRFEEKALRRLFKNAADKKLILSGVFLGNEMLGFSIDEILPNKNAMAHFIKADNSFKGIYEFLNQELAKYLKNFNIELWNWQQDLNIENLRKTKLGYCPVAFLKRYTVSLNNKK